MKEPNKKTLFDETKLKNLKLKSRVFFGPVFDDSFKDGKFTEEGLKKYDILSKNDVALIVTGSVMVGDYFHSPMRGQESFRIDIDDHIEELKKLTDIVHKNNTYILIQLVHPGLFTILDTSYSPSGDINKFTNKESKEMKKEDILRIQDCFVKAAIRAKKAGFDGIEIHGGHLALVSLFLSSKFNRRKDEYGGSEENRARFLAEIIKKIREAIGDNMIISAKIDCEDEENGFTESGFLTAGKVAQEAGLDLIEVTGANPHKEGELVFYNATKKLAENLKIPVVCIGGIGSKENADFAIKNSNIEYVSMARALMKEPDLLKKWKQNK